MGYQYVAQRQTHSGIAEKVAFGRGRNSKCQVKATKPEKCTVGLKFCQGERGGKTPSGDICAMLETTFV